MTKEAEGVLCILSDKIDHELINNSPKLRVVSTMSVGFDHIGKAPFNFTTSHPYPFSIFTLHPSIF